MFFIDRSSRCTLGVHLHLSLVTSLKNKMEKNMHPDWPNNGWCVCVRFDIPHLNYSPRVCTEHAFKYKLWCYVRWWFVFDDICMHVLCACVYHPSISSKTNDYVETTYIVSWNAGTFMYTMFHDF